MQSGIYMRSYLCTPLPFENWTVHDLSNKNKINVQNNNNQYIYMTL